MFCVVFHTMVAAMTMASAGPIRREHTPYFGFWHIVDSHEATDKLHRAMCLALYIPGGMVVAIAVESATLYYIVVVELN